MMSSLLKRWNALPVEVVPLLPTMRGTWIYGERYEEALVG